MAEIEKHDFLKVDLKLLGCSSMINKAILCASNRKLCILLHQNSEEFKYQGPSSHKKIYKIFSHFNSSIAFSLMCSRIYSLCYLNFQINIYYNIVMAFIYKIMYIINEHTETPLIDQNLLAAN